MQALHLHVNVIDGSIAILVAQKMVPPERAG
jgi:hypothetical protein